MVFRMKNIWGLFRPFNAQIQCSSHFSTLLCVMITHAVWFQWWRMPEIWRKESWFSPDESRWKPEPNTVYTYINSDKLYELSCITIFSRIKIRLSDISDILALIKEQNKEGNTIHFLQSPRNILQYNGLEFEADHAKKKKRKSPYTLLTKVYIYVSKA